MAENQQTDGGKGTVNDTAIQNQPAATSGPSDEAVTIKKADYSNVISARDRANQILKDNGIDPTTGKPVEAPPAPDSGGDDLMAELAQERHITKFLADNKEKYPDVTMEDLKLARSPQEVESEARRLQKRIEDATNAKLEEVQKADNTPTLSDSQIDEQIADLKKSNDPHKFEKVMELRLQKSKQR